MDPRSSFDRRILPDSHRELILALQRRVPCTLGGGVALSGGWLGHRLSRDLDLFFSGREELRAQLAFLPALAREAGAEVRVVQDAGTFVRAAIRLGQTQLALDLIVDAIPHIEPPVVIDGVAVESLVDLRAAKLTCLLSRSEPRDLVDVLFLDRAGHVPEADLVFALRKDAGIDPAVLAWLLGEFPVRPLPDMLLPLTVDELASYRDELRERLRRLAVP